MQVWAGAKGRYWVRYWSLQAQRGLESAHLCVSDVQMAAVWRRRWRGKETKEWAGLLEAEILVGRLAGHGSGEGARAISRKHAIDIISEAQRKKCALPAKHGVGKLFGETPSAICCGIHSHRPTQTPPEQSAAWPNCHSTTLTHHLNVSPSRSRIPFVNATDTAQQRFILQYGPASPPFPP